MSSAIAPKRRTRAVLWVLLAVLIAMYGFPFVYLVLTSFKQATETVSIPPAILPKHWTLSNYTAVLRQHGIVPSFVNSITIAVLSTLISMALAVPAAYGVTRYRTRTGQLFMMGALLTRMVPAIAIGVPLVSLMHSIGLTDTPLGVVLAHVTISLPLSIWLMTSFFQSVPTEIDEAALVDGCSRTGSLVRVILPMVGGGMAVTAIFAFLSSWNEFLFALLLTAVRSQTTPIAIANFQTQYGLELGPMTALACLYSLPVVLLTLVLQKRIVAGLSLGAVKG
jgi:multiple sugar transport system permease protein